METGRDIAAECDNGVHLAVALGEECLAKRGREVSNGSRAEGHQVEIARTAVVSVATSVRVAAKATAARVSAWA